MYQSRIRRLGEHGYPHYLLERSAVTIVKAYLGDNGGLPSHEQKITSKIEEQSGEVGDIGWKHIWRVMVLFAAGLITGFFVLLYEVYVPEYAKRDFYSIKNVLMDSIEEWWTRKRYNGRIRGRRVTVNVVTIKKYKK